MLVLKVRCKGLPICPGEASDRSSSSQAGLRLCRSLCVLDPDSRLYVKEPAGKPGVEVSNATGIVFRKKNKV